MGASHGPWLQEKTALLEEAALPPPANLAGARLFHPRGQFETSLNDRFVGRGEDLARIHFELSTKGVPPRKVRRSAAVLRLGLADPFQLPLEALQCGSSLISPNRRLTVVAMAGVHQDADVFKFFLDQGEIMTEQRVLLARERVSIN